MKATSTAFQPIQLDSQYAIAIGRLPKPLLPNAAAQDALWRGRPREFPVISIHGRPTPIPRWQQAFGVDYHFSGQTTKASPVPSVLMPLLDWVREVIDPRLNGVLVNWYDASLGHYIGAHRDSTKHMCPGAPIVTVSLGAERVMRFRRWKGEERHDLTVTGGCVCVLPFATNLAWTHEVLRRAADTGRRISATFRAFEREDA